MGVVDFVHKVVSAPKPPQAQRSAEIIVLAEWRKAHQRRRDIRVDDEPPKERSV